MRAATGRNAQPDAMARKLLEEPQTEPSDQSPSHLGANLVGQEASVGLPTSTPAAPTHPPPPISPIGDHIQMYETLREAPDGSL
jgi:hypothetical protein